REQRTATPLFPYTTLFRSADTITGDLGDDTILGGAGSDVIHGNEGVDVLLGDSGQLDYTGGDLRTIASTASGIGGADTITGDAGDRKSTRLNSSHLVISYA